MNRDVRDRSHLSLSRERREIQFNDWTLQQSSLLGIRPKKSSKEVDGRNRKKVLYKKEGLGRVG